MPDSGPKPAADPAPRDNADTPPAQPTGRALGDGLIAFRYRNYRLLWFGQLVSVTGTWMQALAQAWLVYEILGASPFELGLVNVLRFLPVLLFGIPAGIIADRFPKRSILMVTQSCMMVLAAAMSVLVLADVIQLWHVYVLATLIGLAMAVDMPTRQAFVSELVHKDALMNAIALNSALFNTGRIAGPALAGILLTLMGPGMLFGLNAISYIGILIGLAMMRVAPNINLSSDSPIRRLRDGLIYLRSSPTIFRNIVMVGTIGVFGMNFNVWIPILASDYFNAGSSAYGILYSAMGAGSLIGALSLAFIGRGPNRARMLAGVAVMGLSEIALALVAQRDAALIMGALALAVTGFSTTNATSTANTIVQTAASDLYRGRVMAVYMTVFAGSIPIGALISGWISDQLGAPTSVAMGGTIVVAVAVIQFLIPQRLTSTNATSPSDANAHT